MTDPLVIEVDADTCDQCGVRAYVYTELISGGSLAFCGAHGRTHIPKLAASGATIIDLRHMIT